MLQISQNISSGRTSAVSLPTPVSVHGELLIANRASLISAGTEKMVMDIAKKSLIGKARERPDQVRRVIEKMKTEGVLDTIRQVREKLDQPMGLGYCSAGVVIAAGKGADQYQVGDRVASNGPHAGVVSVPVNLCASIDDSVSYEQASFAVLGSISLQGVRLAKVSLGETVFVIGLGLVGQVAVGLLAAAGCRVIGTDPDPAKCELALQSGAAVAQPNLSASDVQTMSRGAGADAVLITASTSSNGPIELACDAVRAKGRIVLVGVVGLEVPRRPMYFKEVEFVVSCSYGPGRYDPNYEERGIDYPIGHVRWTEQRNIQAVLDLLASGKLSVDHLISHRFEIEKAEEAYQMISEGSEPYVGVVLKYPESLLATPRISLASEAPSGVAAAVKGNLRLGVLGAGNFARMTMFPQLQKTGDFQLTTICSASGMSARSAGEKFGFADCTADEQQVIRDANTDAVMILTRHHLHSGQVCDALDAGKHVFVEKPLAVDGPQLLAVEEAVARNPNRIVMVGFNRRFSAAAVRAKTHFEKVIEPLTIQYRFNAGAIPADVWIQHPAVGGGRIIGEACHAIDLVTFLTGSLPVEVYATCIGGRQAPEIVDDQAFITIRHENGSISSIGYLAGGDRAMSKERVEILGGGKMAVIDDFRRVELASGGRVHTTKTISGKGHLEEVKAFADGLRNGRWPIPWSELLSTSWASIAAVQSLREGMPIPLHFARPAEEDTSGD